MTCPSSREPQTLEQLRARAVPGRCAHCRRPLPKKRPEEQWICSRRPCRRFYQRLHRRGTRPASSLQPVAAVTVDPDRPRRRMLRLGCGCRVSVPASRVRTTARCPLGAAGHARLLARVQRHLQASAH